MKANIIIRSALLMFVLIVVGCSDSDNNNPAPVTETVQSFSDFVQEAFSNSANDEAVSTIEGIDFQFDAADADTDELGTYNVLIANGQQ